MQPGHKEMSSSCGAVGESSQGHKHGQEADAEHALACSGATNCPGR